MITPRSDKETIQILQEMVNHLLPDFKDGDKVSVKGRQKMIFRQFTHNDKGEVFAVLERACKKPEYLFDYAMVNIKDVKKYKEIPVVW